MFRIVVYEIVHGKFVKRNILNPGLFLWGARFRTALNSIGTVNLTLELKHRGLISEWNVVVLEERVNDVWYTENAYIITDFQIVDNENSSKIIYKGRDFNYILKSRLIAPQTTEINGFVNKSGPADDIIKEFVQENLGSAAIAARRLDFLLIDGTTGSCTNTYIEASQSDNLLSVITKLTDQSNVDFWFEVFNDQILFKAGVRGSVKPVTFSIANGNMKNVRYSISRNNYGSKFYVTGQGSGTEQEIFEYPENSHLYNNVGNISRFEIITQSNQTNYGDVQTLANVALQKAYDTRPKVSFQFQVILVPSTQYRTHFDIGDYVTAIYDNEEFTLRVFAIETWLSEQGLTREVELQSE